LWWLQSSAVESSASVQQLQLQCRRRLQETCLAINDSWSEPWRFIVSHKLRFVFCMIGKSACTSWVRVLLQLTGNPAAQRVAASDRAAVHSMFYYYLDLMSFKNASQLASAPLKDYYKFMFVREPLERLVSAYRDKMFRVKEYFHTRQYIISQFRRHPSPRLIRLLAYIIIIGYEILCWLRVAMNKHSCNPWVNLYTGWAIKTGPVWALITHRGLPVEKQAICQKF